MSDVLKYEGRLYDASAFQNIPEPGERRQLKASLADEGTSGAIVTGVQKVIQWVLMELLETTGSALYLDNRGTEFLRDLRQGRLRTEVDVFTKFNFAAAKILRRIQADQKQDDPPDEQLTRIRLDRYTISPERVQMFVSVTTAAGETREFIMPIEVLP